jgi:hypothetical protein
LSLFATKEEKAGLRRTTAMVTETLAQAASVQVNSSDDSVEATDDRRKRRIKCPQKLKGEHFSLLFSP